jgi:hypothetical protein
MEDLSSGIPVKKNGKLLNLHPFLDKDVLISVDGRLQKASRGISQKHQVILSPKCHLTRLIVEEEHNKNYVWRSSNVTRLVMTSILDSQWKIVVQEDCSLLQPAFQDEGLIGAATDVTTATAASYTLAPIL